jgi:hypothetical protein
MKKQQQKFRCLVLIIIFAFTSFNSVQAEGFFGKILKFIGEIRIMRPGETKKIKVDSANYEVKPNETVLVGPGSKIFMQMPDKSRMVLFEKTAIQPKNKNLLKIIQGKVAFNIKKRPLSRKKFTVRTVNASIGVKGTRFLTEYRDEDTQIFLKTGSLCIESLEKEFFIYQKKKEKEFEDLVKKGEKEFEDQLKKKEKELEDLIKKGEKEFEELIVKSVELNAGQSLSISGKKAKDIKFTKEAEDDLKLLDDWE